MKHLKKYEDKTSDDILDKISSSGLDSLTKHEKNYLDKKSRGESVTQDKKEDAIKKYTGKIGSYEASLKIIMNDSDNNQLNGILIVNDVEYDGYIEYLDNDYKTSFFSNDDSDIYTDLEGLEYEIDSFCQEAFYNYID